jgi:hypothetical protein
MDGVRDLYAKVLHRDAYLQGEANPDSGGSA